MAKRTDTELLKRTEMIKSAAEGVEAKAVMLTPEIAKKILANNFGDQRPVRESKVRQLVTAIKRGNWRFNGEPIQISDRGALLNGQHRCHAVIASGVSIPVLIVEGIQEEAFSTYDQARPRSYADVLNHPNATTVSSAAALMFTYKKQKGAFKGGQLGPQDRADNTEIVSFVSENEDLLESVRCMHGQWNKIGKIMARGVAAFLHCVFARIDKTDADLFFDLLASGEALRGGDPVYVLRERLISVRSDSSKGQINRAWMIAIIIKAWNAHRQGRKISTLRFKDAERFPTPA